jgi:hypothetical protein
MREGRFAGDSGDPPRRDTPAPPAGTTASVDPGTARTSSDRPGRGFGAAFRSLVERKYRELSSRARWSGVSERQRRAEATARSARDMSRRIERETGRRPAESTVRRNASRDAIPRGVNPGRMDRQAAIDRAGGIKPFAQRAGITTRQATRWRDSGGTIRTTDTIVIDFHVTGDLQHGVRHEGEPETMQIDKDLDDKLTLSGPDADDFIQAYASDDIDTQKTILGEQISHQLLLDWNGDITRIYTVRTIIRLAIDD